MANPAPYTKDWYAVQQVGASGSAGVILPLVIDLVSPRSVVDVGCGVGAWLAYLYSTGIRDILGVDGDWVDDSQLLIPRELFVRKDIGKPFDVGRTADLTICLEVAEHVAANAADHLVRALTATSPVVLFSAAIPWQGGTNHVNEQWPEYWAERFARLGYVPVDAIRRRVWTNPAVEWWYAQNVLLYVKQTTLTEFPKLEQEVREGFGAAVPLVHPQRYLKLLERVTMLDKLSTPRPSVASHIRRALSTLFRRMVG